MARRSRAYGQDLFHVRHHLLYRLFLIRSWGEQEKGLGSILVCDCGSHDDTKLYKIGHSLLRTKTEKSGTLQCTAYSALGRTYLGKPTNVQVVLFLGMGEVLLPFLVFLSSVPPLLVVVLVLCWAFFFSCFEQFCVLLWLHCLFFLVLKLVCLRVCFDCLRSFLFLIEKKKQWMIVVVGGRRSWDGGTCRSTTL